MNDVRSGPRIALIHALPESPGPAAEAFAHGWPQARIFNIEDDSLATDLAVEGRLSESMHERFLALGRYAASTGPAGDRTAAILFTCSAFGPAIDGVRDALPIPVLRPNEAAFEAALGTGSRIGLIVSFGPSQAALELELRRMAKARGQDIEISSVVVEGALAALKAGDGAGHDRLVAGAAAGLNGCDVIVLGQFSLARAAACIAPGGPPVLTTPGAAVSKLKALLQRG